MRPILRHCKNLCCTEGFFILFSAFGILCSEKLYIYLLLLNKYFKRYVDYKSVMTHFFIDTEIFGKREVLISYQSLYSPQIFSTIAKSRLTETHVKLSISGLHVNLQIREKCLFWIIKFPVQILTFHFIVIME